MDDTLGTAYLRDVLRGFRTYRELGEKAIAQVASDTDLNRQLDTESNSIAIIVKHVRGNLRSRFTNFLTTDGEKPDRHRDTEFESDRALSRDEILQWWNDGFAVLLATVASLRPEDLDRTVTIRKEQFLVIEALNRSLMHVAYHVGQIVYVARHFATDWHSLSIPKGKSVQA